MSTNEVCQITLREAWKHQRSKDDYYYNHKEEIKERVAQYEEEKRQEAFKILGNQCVICNQPNIIKIIGKHKNTHCFHEIYGNPHEYHGINYVLKNKEKFVTTCRKCHLWIHVLMKVFKMNWNQIKKLRDELYGK